jgi:nitronate monooxygenase
MRKELAAIRAGTSKPFNVNFFCHTQPQPDPAAEAHWREVLAPYYREFGIDAASIPAGPGRLPFSSEAADLLDEFKPEVVSFHFGLPSDELMQRVLDEALWLRERGVDAIIAQGYEAGGHRGIFLTSDLTTQVGTFALVRQIVQAVGVPVIAAGGIADAAGVAAAMALGAAGVQAGTAYLLCPESTIGPLYRAALASPAARHTAVTNLFTGRPARGIVNRVMRELGPLNADAPAFPLATSSMAPLRAKAEAQGVDGFTSLWSGQNPSGCAAVPAAEITRRLAEGLPR